eukprot:TRINITY_DN3117_c0_g1_i3.p1 TRINITY_DN3117_c0_g1~~TRINITY_DN3117_c0_g1_i3.p1  ORF type:complete len:195 (-),score=6.50 TRINITY_DN3117_c0_g1_i3:86-670(-)
MAREASHAGSWYTDDAKELDGELEGWLGSCHIQGSPMARAIIAPHAGFRYSGRCAAFAFAQIDPASVSRIFLLGPSHHHFTKGCCLSPARVYRTPLGDAPVDQEVYAELKATGRFEMMSASVDAAEHSLEMHLPYLVKVMNGYVVWYECNFVPFHCSVKSKLALHAVSGSRLLLLRGFCDDVQPLCCSLEESLC